MSRAELFRNADLFIKAHNMVDDTPQDVLERNGNEWNEVMYDLLFATYPDALFYLSGLGDPTEFCRRRLQQFYTAIERPEKILDMDAVINTYRNRLHTLFPELIMKYFEGVARMVMVKGMGIPVEGADTRSDATSSDTYTTATHRRSRQTSSSTTDVAVMNELKELRKFHVEISGEIEKMERVIEGLKCQVREERERNHTLRKNLHAAVEALHRLRLSTSALETNTRTHVEDARARGAVVTPSASARLPVVDYPSSPSSAHREASSVNRSATHHNPHRRAMSELLRTLNLDSFEETMFKAGYDDIRSLPILTEAEMQTFGMKPSHIYRMQRFIEEQLAEAKRASGASTSSSTASLLTTRTSQPHSPSREASAKELLHNSLLASSPRGDFPQQGPQQQPMPVGELKSLSRQFSSSPGSTASSSHR